MNTIAIEHTHTHAHTREIFCTKIKWNARKGASTFVKLVFFSFDLLFALRRKDIKCFIKKTQPVDNSEKNIHTNTKYL